MKLSRAQALADCIAWECFARRRLSTTTDASECFVAFAGQHLPASKRSRCLMQVHISTHEDPTKMTVMWMTTHSHCPSVVLYAPGPMDGDLPRPSLQDDGDVDEAEVATGGAGLRSVSLTAADGTALGRFRPSPEGVVTTLDVRS